MDVCRLYILNYIYFYSEPFHTNLFILCKVLKVAEMR